MTNSCPSARQFRAFSKKVRGLGPTGELRLVPRASVVSSLPSELAHLVPEAVLACEIPAGKDAGGGEAVRDLKGNDPTWHWFMRQKLFTSALHRLQNSAPEFKAEWQQVQLAGYVAGSFADYLDSVEGRLRPRVVTKRERKEKLNAVREFRCQVGNRIEFRNPRDTQHLANMLAALEKEVAAPQLVATRNSKRLPLRYLSCQLAQLLGGFGPAEDPFCLDVIVDLVSLVDRDSVDRREVVRAVAPVLKASRAAPSGPARK